MLRLLRRRRAVRDGRDDLVQLLFPHVACGKTPGRPVRVVSSAQ